MDRFIPKAPWYGWSNACEKPVAALSQPTNAEIMDKLDQMIDLLIKDTTLADWVRERQRKLYG